MKLFITLMVLSVIGILILCFQVEVVDVDHHTQPSQPVSADNDDTDQLLKGIYDMSIDSLNDD